MVKIVYTGVNKPKPQGRPASVRQRDIIDSEGKQHSQLEVDITSPTFGEDLLYVFGKNVAKARHENLLLQKHTRIKFKT